MALNKIFDKKIDRNIDGVIKADDIENLKQELEEYVITRELEKHLGNFFDAYNDYKSANGVWISGFFGSGKSHLLKMLSLVLENDSIDDAKVSDIFLDKQTFKENIILRKGIEKASVIPSKSILFNIDAKSAVTTTDQNDAILSVFVKVFDEFCGYSPKNPYIAQFERELDEAGLFQDFIKEIESLTNKKWSLVRERKSRFNKEIDQAYNKIADQNIENILLTYSKDYALSIEDFANQVHSYINSQGNNFRLNFFVDEVGQYIAGNTTLMLNLQSIAESLNTRCKGRSWIVVTSQEEMKDLVGEVGTQQRLDFSKIQARFANRMNLTSQDVAEVIQKRLLLKNESGVNVLSTIYDDQKNNFNTLFTFLDGAQEYKSFNDKEHFTYCYPFIPYQFSLFQETMQGLSAHNAFQGRHSSVGERSMLDVFQNVTIQVSDYQLGDLATFDLMFEGVRNILKSQIQNRILLAENQLSDEFAIKILKALFLVKYVKGIKTTVRNICVLMISSFEHDAISLKSKVEESLQLLEQQTYIKRKDTQYEFLTDEEKDIEEEIKNTIVEQTDLSDELNTIIFGRILRDPKIKYKKNNQDYKFNQKIDEELKSRDTEELSISIITPLNQDAGNNDPFLFQSMSRDDLFIVMPVNLSLVHNLTLYKQTHKFLRQHDSNSVDLATNQIVSERGSQNERLMKELVQQVMELIVQSEIIIKGEKIESIASNDAKTFIIAGFNHLIDSTYPNLEMIPFDSVFTDTKLTHTLESTQSEISTELSNAEQEIFSYIKLQTNTALRLTYKALLAYFEMKPFGWSRISIHCLTANLFTKAKIELRKDSSILEGKELKTALQTNNQWPNIVIQLQADFSALEIRNLKTFYEDYFSQPSVSSDAKNLANEANNSFDSLARSLRSLSSESNIFPFTAVFNEAIIEIESKAGHEYSWYLKELHEFQQKLIKSKTEIIDPIKSFMQGPQKTIYITADAYITANFANKEYFEGDEFQSIIDALADENCYKGDVIQTIKINLGKCKTTIDKVIQAKRKTEATNIEDHKARFKKSDGFNKLTNEQKVSVDNSYTQLTEEINKTTLIDSIPGKLSTFENGNYKQLLDLLNQEEPGQNQPISEYVKGDSIKVSFNSPLITSENDVENYTKALKIAYLQEIKAGKKIQL